MSIAEDPIAIIGSAFSLPGGLSQSSELWSAIVDGCWSKCSTPPPDSRSFKSLAPEAHYIERAGWIGREGVEEFDAAFFNISPGEARTLRPNCRLAMELTHKALENAGLSPTGLQGKNVAVSIAVGTEDGWDMRRAAREGDKAFDHNWATSSDPSAISGRIAHFFNFRGACSTVSNACASGTFALREGIQSLFHDGADLAIVGALCTHWHPAAFAWASSVSVASPSGRCSAFSDEADGYAPSEGAVFFVLKKSTQAQEDGDVITVLIRSVSIGHNGATRTLTTPNVSAQIDVARRALSSARLSPGDITYLEAHGTGTKLGDMLEMEAIQAVYSGERKSPLLVSSIKTILGHCQAAAALVGILKVTLCFEHKSIPPHHVQPVEQYTRGNIQVPLRVYPLDNSQPTYAAISSFGFTGSVTSIILETPPYAPSTHISSHPSVSYLLPFSAKCEAALLQHIRGVAIWAKTNACSLNEMATVLSLTRAHYNFRHAIIASEMTKFVDHCLSEDFDVSGTTRLPCSTDPPHGPDQGVLDMLNLSGLREDLCDGQDRVRLDSLIASGAILEAATLLYERGHNLDFDRLYTKSMISPFILRSFPTYPFQRSEWWDHSGGTSVIKSNFKKEEVPNIIAHRDIGSSSKGLSQQFANTEVANIIGSVLHLPPSRFHPDSNIFDLGIDSINSIELAKTLSSHFCKAVTAADLYALLTVEAIALAITSVTQDPHKTDPQTQMDDLVEEFGAPLLRDPSHSKGTIEEINILLTGATGSLGSAVLACLLKSPNVRIFCPIRGEPMSRLYAVFKAKGHSVADLAAAKAAGRLVTVKTDDLSNPIIGCSSEEYLTLLQQVNVIVHGAWRLDFNLPVDGFRSTLLATRRLAQFCADSYQKVTYHFITSFSASFGFPGESVPETPLPGKTEYAIRQGYAISKLVAEHLLYRLQKQDPDLFNLTIIRVGQICGHSQTGSWSREEMIPMMFASLATIKAVPEDMPAVSWIPSDTCAETLCDLVLSGSQQSIEVHNIANPHIVPWAQIVQFAAPSWLNGKIRLVSWTEYISLIHAAVDPKPPISRLLPYFEASARSRLMPSRFCNLDVTKTARNSPSLRRCPEITAPFIKMLCSTIDADFSREPSISSLPNTLSQLSVNPRVENNSPVFLFGPWSTKFSQPEDNINFTRILAILQGYAQESLPEAPEQPPIDGTLFIQLQTLALQLANYDDMCAGGVTPCAVVGYCFGEFAAAIASGILSARVVVSILVQRALALRGVSGAMLNVFTDIKTVRSNLAGLFSPPDIAIHAGPLHVVLSGSTGRIDDAKAAFERAAVKTLPVKTSIPYHSGEVDPALELFGRLAPYTVNPGHCIYVSSVTGTTIAHERLGPSYWIRHMREPVHFLSSMETIRLHLRKNTIIDIGPEVGIQSIVARYGWDKFQVIPARNFLATLGAAGQPRVIQRRGAMIRQPEDRRCVQSSTVCLTSMESSRGGSLESTYSGNPAISDIASDLLSTSVSLSVLPSGSREERGSIALDILNSLFGYERSPDHLHETIHTLGIDSLSFVRFAEAFEKKSGLTLPPSYFATDLTLGNILSRLEIK